MSQTRRSGPATGRPDNTNTTILARRFTSGGRLAAAAALIDGRRTWTDEQVVYLVALAYESGLHGRLEADLAELHTQWMTNAQRAATADERKAARLAYYTEQYAALNERMGRPLGYSYSGGAVDWATGRPVRHLQAVAA